MKQRLLFLMAHRAQLLPSLSGEGQMAALSTKKKRFKNLREWHHSSACDLIHGTCWGYQWHGLTLQLTWPMDRKKLAFCRVKHIFKKIYRCQHSHTNLNIYYPISRSTSKVLWKQDWYCTPIYGCSSTAVTWFKAYLFCFTCDEEFIRCSWGSIIQSKWFSPLGPILL